MNNQILNDEALDVVTGGAPMSCSTADTVAHVLHTLAVVNYACGNTSQANAYDSQSVGIRQGSGCPGK